jgi:chemotaxis protein MotB
MGRGCWQLKEDETPGAPEWMVTFSDCMTLLLTFFVLLLSFSSFDERVFLKLQTIFMDALPAVNKSDKKSKDSVLFSEHIQEEAKLFEGSEKPTLLSGLDNNLKEETPVDFRRRKVFSISSKEIFWGKGALISDEGGRIMTKMASFLKEVPSRVVVSENGPSGEEDAEQLGLSRAWVIMEYLTTEQKLDKKQFSISTAGTMAQESLGSSGSPGVSTGAERTVEIILLERSIYD